MYQDSDLQSSRIYRAARTLKLQPRATMEEIKRSYRTLIKKWHPDRCQENPEKCKQKTEKIVEAYRIIMVYCNNYRYSFKKEEIIDNLPPDQRARENFIKQFGSNEGPLWE